MSNKGDDKKSKTNANKYKCCDPERNPFMSLAQPVSSRAVTAQSKQWSQQQKERGNPNNIDQYRTTLKYFQETVDSRFVGLNRLMKQQMKQYDDNQKEREKNNSSKYGSSGSGSSSSKSKKGLFN